MKCPTCESNANLVKDTRHRAGGIVRMRLCECGFKFYTMELAVRHVPKAHKHYTFEMVTKRVPRKKVKVWL